MAASIHRVRATAGTALFESAAAPLGDYASIAIGTNCMATIGCHDAHGFTQGRAMPCAVPRRRVP